MCEFTSTAECRGKRNHSFLYLRALREGFEQRSLCIPEGMHASWCPDPLCATAHNGVAGESLPLRV
ncbi:MAG: hypothetical protein UY00_C0036G0012 [Candidatus Wolfebacteria bacterium GW2011_GWA1_47_6]|nr:MAG: hypothetical protein UY00_C0036G0012 [Candidatus Wolfebacteria bacterium GW2011_GWA1_47_6]